ncbi:MAG: NrfD/PsrC family molybdoenzyme membrane anchor subunit [Candidatus Acetothermia bacterium]
MDLATVNDIGLWHWPVGLHFVLSAMVGGLIGLGGLAHLLNKKSLAHAAIFTSIPVLALDLLALWLDLTSRWHVFWLFLNFRVTSAISWGSWSLLLSGVVAVIYIAAFIGFIRPPEKVENWLASALILLSLAVTSYTGAMFSTSSAARPLWASMILAPMFFASALAMAGGFMEIFNAGDKIPSWVLAVSTLAAAVMLGFYIGELYAGTYLVRGGLYNLLHNYGLLWWLTVGLGFGVPSIMGTWWLLTQRRRVWGTTKIIGLLSLFGGVGLRFVLLMAGQGH